MYIILLFMNTFFKIVKIKLNTEVSMIKKSSIIWDYWKGCVAPASQTYVDAMFDRYRSRQLDISKNSSVFVQQMNHN